MIRGRIVLPEWVVERAVGERALVLAHEEEHLRAGDPRLLLLALLLLVVLPWNPVLWWQWRRLRQVVELDCDCRVLAGGNGPARGHPARRHLDRQPGAALPRAAVEDDDDRVVSTGRGLRATGSEKIRAWLRARSPTGRMSR